MGQSSLYEHLTAVLAMVAQAADRYFEPSAAKHKEGT